LLNPLIWKSRVRVKEKAILDGFFELSLELLSLAFGFKRTRFVALIHSPLEAERLRAVRGLSNVVNGYFCHIRIHLEPPLIAGLR